MVYICQFCKKPIESKYCISNDNGTFHNKNCAILYGELPPPKSC